MGRTAVFMAVVALLAGCGGSTVSGADAGAELACSHFRNVARDVVDGVLTDAELREKIKEVESDARLSDGRGIAFNARQMLAAITDSDMDALERHVNGFGSACEELGL